MEPQQARLTLFVFLALSGVIVFNALYLQKDAGIIPAKGPVSGVLNRVDGSSSSSSSLAAVSGQTESDEKKLLRAIRRELTRRNYFPGNANSRLDGRLDVMTIGAIMAYQYDNGLKVTGVASQNLLKEFLFAGGKKRPSGKKIPDYSPGTRRLVAEIQGILSARGYYRAKIDGIFKSRTVEAVRRFEAARGLPVTGRISGLLIQELMRSTGTSFRS